MIQVPVQVTARGFKLADWWKDALRQKVDKLEEFHHRITAVHVVVDAVTRHHRKGRVYKVRVDIEVPRGLVVIDREPSPTLEEAIERAFDAAERKLEDLSRRLRGDVKRHEAPPEGTVREVFPESGYGFLETADGREV
ncbi:MAG: ribosome-associated translation inhibitor RaiA, partial [Elusimicrobia bacterium]|nr:ribosome-associated translation inhibitor RaiA [Elusimicrobiota bacterium]